MAQPPIIHIDDMADPVVTPALAAWRLPLPLGGSSNHFRTSALETVGGWDPYNVTEDADLGMRLARQGYSTAVIASTTYEEAPARFGPWLKQRSRWFKGWMQTWAVHMRRPFVLYRELGLAGFVVFQLIVGGTVFAALVHPFVTCALIYSLVHASWQHMQSELLGIGLIVLQSTTFVTGYAASILLGLFGLARRKLLRHAGILLLTPILWFLLSLAAWRGLIQLMRNPYHWEKDRAWSREDFAEGSQALEIFLQVCRSFFRLAAQVERGNEIAVFVH